MVPNEKMTEMLFNRYFLQSFGLGNIILYAPSSREEYEKGYDAKLTSSQSFNEVFLQFKRPQVKNDQFLLRTTAHQHTNLQDRPSDSCYYVGHTFRDLEELEQAQKGLSASQDFLRYFILVEISCLDPNLTTIVYERNEKSLIPRTVSAIHNLVSGSGRTREKKTRIRSEKYFTGTAFKKAFNSKEVGIPVSLPTDDELLGQACARQIGSTEKDIISTSGVPKSPRQIWRPDPSMIKSISAVGSQAKGKRGSFGLLYRMPTD